MTITDSATEVRVSTETDAPIERAFEVFTTGIGTWWDPRHHLIEGPLDMVFEPWVGGNVYDRGADGSECRWSRVLAYDPPRLVRFSWDISVAWELEPDPAKASEIEVTFSAVTPDRTRVELVHRHLDRHGEGWEAMRDAVGSGWDLSAYAATAAR